jgi:hypothetical protein
MNYETLMNDVWRDHWLFIHEQGIAPVLVGAWGGVLREPNTNWMAPFVQLLKTYELSFTYWCLNPNSGDTGGLLKDDWITWDEEKWQFIKPAFYSDSSAKERRGPRFSRGCQIRASFQASSSILTRRHTCSKDVGTISMTLGTYQVSQASLKFAKPLCSLFQRA